MTETFESTDGHIGKVKIHCGRNGASYVRPITLLCCLIEVDLVVNAELVFVKVTTILSVRLVCSNPIYFVQFVNVCTFYM